MDPLTVVTAVITIAGAVCTSYEQISKFVTNIRNAPKVLEGVRSRAWTIHILVMNLKQALEEAAIRKVVETDMLALKHVKALNEPLRAVGCMLDEVINNLTRQYQPTSDGKLYKIRWRYFLNTTEWDEMQARLGSDIQALGASMQGLNTLNVLRVLGSPSKDPAITLRTYAQSILETPKGKDHIDEERTINVRRTPSPIPSSTSDPNSPLPLDERRLLAKKKQRLQRELLQAARNGDDLDVFTLLAEGVETEWTEETEGKTALTIAAQYGHLRVAEELLKAGADIEAQCDAFGDHWVVCTEKGRTPLIWAASARDCPHMQERMCRLLLDKGADVNARNSHARTALQEAAMSVRFNKIDPRGTMELLLQRGAHVNAYDKGSWTALTECAFYGMKEAAELLLAHGAHVDGKPGEDDPASGNNPDLEVLHQSPLIVCARQSWNEELICLLLDKGADVRCKNTDGNTMQELANAAKRAVVLDALARLDNFKREEATDGSRVLLLE
ncbi:MAG: hypothetical protein Q9205_007651 [Flavoplaca limonia]